MNSEQLVIVILGILGVVLQMAFKYMPKFSNWYQSHPNKGLVALIFAVVIGVIYFGLSCTPYASQFKIALVCNQDGAFTLLNAIFVIASTQQLTYLFTKNKSIYKE